ncbi:type IV secretion system DNA-binding domain-containing protein [Burkholderia vietnamiensis]|uniref:TraD/TraG TraM recognition site domain-containing protein n=1 Tax=Burkholderia vietnamiensis (strain G4 / LMG 22486) TaxID=269482 RepID=A4JFJ7_BURVG|nr:hypothetical protein Bcep1808_2048 [Burkholderia vietnamiensis G4]MCB4344810.1 type IV secretion system DNA-binding domain-containing protein [Burkholderia vietnamiensis]
MNRKGRREAPLAGIPVEISDLTMCQHIAIEGATGQGKTETTLKTILKQAVAQIIDLQGKYLRQRIEDIDAGYPVAVPFRAATLRIPALSIFLMDPKAMLAALARELGDELGQSANIRLLGTDTTNGEFTIDLLAGLTPQKALDLLKDAVIRGGGRGGDNQIWGDLATNVERAGLTLASVWQYTEEGYTYAIANNIAPYSFLFLRNVLFDPSKQMIPACLDDIERAVQSKNKRVIAMIADSAFYAEVDELLSERWLGLGGSDETKMGIRVNVMQHLSPICSIPAIAETFGAGYSKNMMTVREMWSPGMITASNVSSSTHGEPANVLNTFIKARFLTEADDREARFKTIGANAAAKLRKIHLHLFQEELGDLTSPATQRYIDLQMAAWPILRRVADEMIAQGKWPFGAELMANDQWEPLFGSGPQQSQFRRAKLWIDTEIDRVQMLLGPDQEITQEELEQLAAPEKFRERNNTAGLAREREKFTDAELTSAGGFFRGDAISMDQLLSRNQLGLEEVIAGMAQEEALLSTYIENLGAPASPGEQLLAIPPAIARSRMIFMIDEYTTLATPKLDTDSAKMARSKGLSWIIAFQTQATLEEAMPRVEVAYALLEQFRNRFILADESEKTPQMIRSLSGQVWVRDPKRSGKGLKEQSFEAKFLAKAGANDPSMPLFTRLDDFSQGLRGTSMHDAMEPDEFADALNEALSKGEPLGGMCAIARPLQMHAGTSFAKQADFETDRPESDGSKADRNNLAGFKRGEKHRVEDKEDERTNAPRRREDPILREEWAGNNLVFAHILVGRRPVVDLVNLDFDQDGEMARAKEMLGENQRLVNELNAREKARNERMAANAPFADAA